MGHSKAEAALFSVRDSYDGTGESILAILDVVKMAKILVVPQNPWEKYKKIIF